MKPELKACGQALLTATINACLALALMLLIEFAISGSLQLTKTYRWAVTVIGVVIFVAQFWRQRHLCRNRDSGRHYYEKTSYEKTSGKKIQM